MSNSTDNTLIPTLNKEYWDMRWKQNQIGWDIGQPSPAIVHYMMQYPNKKSSILIPGCGNAYEAQALLDLGFEDITLVDIAPEVVSILQNKFQNFTKVNVLCEDFFQHQGKYNLIIEQTFFCAISPTLRSNYVRKVFDLLNSKGKIIGLLFNRTFAQDTPPYGGSVDEYYKLFSSLFDIKTLAPCYNSIPPRNNTELFINFQKI